MSLILQVLFFYLLLVGLVVWPRSGDPFLSENPIIISIIFIND